MTCTRDVGSAGPRKGKKKLSWLLCNTGANSLTAQCGGKTWPCVNITAIKMKASPSRLAAPAPEGDGCSVGASEAHLAVLRLLYRISVVEPSYSAMDRKA